MATTTTKYSSGSSYTITTTYAIHFISYVYSENISEMKRHSKATASSSTKQEMKNQTEAKGSERLRSCEI